MNKQQKKKSTKKRNLIDMENLCSIIYCFHQTDGSDDGDRRFALFLSR